MVPRLNPLPWVLASPSRPPDSRVPLERGTEGSRAAIFLFKELGNPPREARNGPNEGRLGMDELSV
jgi:hypothetical protein